MALRPVQMQPSPSLGAPLLSLSASPPPPCGMQELPDDPVVVFVVLGGGEDFVVVGGGEDLVVVGAGADWVVVGAAAAVVVTGAAA